MAGIEKVCEFSGEYPGWKMYDYKRNHIQIMPEYRKLFKGCSAELHIAPREWCIINGFSSQTVDSDIIKPQNKTWDDYFDEGGGYLYWTPSEGRMVQGFESIKELKQFMKEERHGSRVVQEYVYCLKVEDETLQGGNKGLYYNYSVNISTVIRKMKRLTGNYGLPIIKHKDEDSLFEFVEETPK